jgi:hypothetical protein
MLCEPHPPTKQHPSIAASSRHVGARNLVASVATPKLRRRPGDLSTWFRGSERS